MPKLQYLNYLKHTLLILNVNNIIIRIYILCKSYLSVYGRDQMCGHFEERTSSIHPLYLRTRVLQTQHP